MKTNPVNTEVSPFRVQTLRQRPLNLPKALRLAREGSVGLMAQILSARGVDSLSQISARLGLLIHHSFLEGTAQAAQLLYEAIERGVPMVIVADYDCDGATACAVALRGLLGFGANIEYVVPDRMVHGYGLTPSVVDLALERYPQTKLLITVDNGVSSHAGVQAAVDRGLDVLITDHHLPAKDKQLPNAKVIVDPALPGCLFPSKALAGVGVIWYVLWALQDHFRAQGKEVLPEQKVSRLLPLVAVGTVADVVPLDYNNRVLVQAGLERIRAGEGFAGIEALACVGFGNRTQLERLQTSDIAFGIGPRINAAGRLESMEIGIECLTCDDPERAKQLATQLNNINQERKSIEKDTVDDAVEQAYEQLIEGNMSITVFGSSWHQGVIGIVAGRIKEQRWRPTFVLALDEATGQIKGSGRSIPGFNLKDALDQVDKSEPGLLVKFGGHAMAAGLTLAPGGFERFRDAFEAQTRLHMDPALLSQVVEHDGSLEVVQLNIATFHELAKAPWGQQFPEPSFCDEFEVVEAQRSGAGRDQLKMLLKREGLTFEAVAFRYTGELPKGPVRLIYKLNRRLDKWYNERLVLLVDHLLPVGGLEPEPSFSTKAIAL